MILHWNKIESPSPKDALWQVWLKLVQWFLKRVFLKMLSMYFSCFVYISPWNRTGALHLNKLESLSPKDALCQVWLNLVQWFLRGDFFYFVNVFFLFCNYLPLEKGECPSFEQTWIPFTQGCFVPSSVVIGLLVFE